MTWRQLPPVLSPVSLTGLAMGVKSASGLGNADFAAVRRSLSARHGVDDAILTDTGTSALVLALKAVCEPGGTVAYPAYACIDLTTAALAAGLRVRLYDLDPNTLSPDLDSVRSVIGRGVDVIVVAHLFGYAADVPGVERIAAEYGIPVIEDGAQGAGGTLDGRRLGGISNLSTLSFGRGKGTTSGSGGAVLVRGPELTGWAARARQQLGAPPKGGREVISLSAQLIFSQPHLYSIPASVPALKLGEMVYHPPTAPRPMSHAAGAILSRALDLDLEEIRVRREHAALLMSGCTHRSTFAPVRPLPTASSGFLRFAAYDVKGKALLPRSLGAMRGYPLTLADHVQLRDNLEPLERAGSGAVQLRDTLFTLPTHSGVSARDVERLLEWLQGTPARLPRHLSPARA